MLAFYLLVAATLAYRWAGSQQAPFGTQLIAFWAWFITLILVPLQALGVVSAMTRLPVVTLSGGGAVLLVLGSVEFTAFRARRVAWRRPSLMGWSALELVLLGLVGLVALGGLVYGVTHPPIGWDNQHYHLPRALTFLQEQTLTEYYPRPGDTLKQFENALGFSACHAYPGNWSLYLSVLARSRLEALLSVAQYPFALLMGLVAYRMVRELGGQRGPSLMALATVVTSPLVMNQGVVPYADLFCAAFLLAAGLFLIEGALPLSGLCTGLALGAKSTSLIYGLLLILLAVAGQLPRIKQVWAVIRSLALAASCLLLPAAFWYGQNWILYGSPVLPFELKLFGRILFPGLDSTQFGAVQEAFYVSSPAEWFVYPWRETFNMETGFGWLWATMLPAALAVLFLSGRSVARRGAVHLVVAFTLGSFLVWWKLTHHEPRYMLHVVGLIGVLGAYAIGHMGQRARTAAMALVLIGCLGNAKMLFGVLRAKHFPSWSRNDYVGWVSDTPAAMLDRIDALPPMRIFNDKRGEVQSTTVLYALSGSRFQHRVLDDQNLKAPNAATFRSNLKSRGVDYVFVVARTEDACWARYRPEVGFEPCYVTDHQGVTQALFRVRPDL